MPSVSKKQQRFFQLVKAVQNGKVKKKDVSKSVKDAAKSMTKKQVSDFADYRSSKHRVKKISEMFDDTGCLVSERMKIKPVTSTEFDEMQAKLKNNIVQLFIVWPASRDTVDEIVEYCKSKNIDPHKHTNKSNQSLFVLAKNTVKELINADLLRNFDDKIFIMNPKFNENDIKDVVVNAFDHNEIYTFLDNRDNAHQLSKEQIIKDDNISWE